MDQQAEPLIFMPSTGPLSIRSRYVFMTEVDWRAFSDALAEHFPDAKYRVVSHGPHVLTTDQPPKFRYHRDLISAGGWLDETNGTEMIFDPDWEPKFAKYRPYVERKDELWWIILNHARPSVWFRATKLRSVEDIKDWKGMGNDQIDFYSDPNDKAQTALRSRFHRLLGKFTTNRHQTFYRMPQYEFLRTEEKGSQYWLGHDAIRWAREDKRRLLYYDYRGWGYRPNDEGIVKPEVKPRKSKPTRPPRQSSAP